MALKRGVFFLLALCLLAGGCGQRPNAGAQKDAVVTVNNYNIMRDEFESEFRASAYGDTDTPESRRNFANTLIDRKLILQYAQRTGLDKEEAFLKAIERFWEQSLLKVALDRKTREIESKIPVSDWAAKRTEEAKRMSDWMNELRQGAHVTIQDSVLTGAAGQEGSR
jgi:hypothetical protein